MNDAPIKTLWDNDRAMREIESLRQQLADSQKQVALLRSTIHKAMGTCFDRQSYERCMADPTYFINVALSATADLTTEPKP